MRKLYYILMSVILFFVSLLFAACSSVKVDGGQEAVLIMKPFFFGHGGVDSEPVKPGRTWVALTTDAVIFDVVPIKYSERFDDMISSDNAKMDLDLFITLQIKQGETPSLYDNFGIEWYANNIKPAVRSGIRKLVSAYTALESASKKSVIDSIEQSLISKITSVINEKGIPVIIHTDGVQISKVTPPESVLKQTEETVIQKQSILTQKARKDAEKARKDAEEARGLADKAYQKTLNLTVSEYLETERIKVMSKAAEQGKLTIIQNGSPNAIGTYLIR